MSAAAIDSRDCCRRVPLHLVAGALLLVLTAVNAGPQDPQQSSPQDDGFLLADDRRAFEFPRDHGDHPEYRTEWWYFTGALESEAGELFGFQATWFRSALVAAAPQRSSPLATRDLFLFHGALTDVAQKRFVYDDRISRRAAGWASAAPDTLDVHVFNRRAVREESGRWRIAFTVEGRRIELVLDPERQPLLHGDTPGLSRKGPARGQASYYVSHTRLRTEGTIEREPGGERIPVTGQTWFDHEFGSNQLAAGQVGWDWFSIALDDGTDVMLYALRREDGTIEAASSGTVRLPDGTPHHVVRDDFAIDVTAHWQSPASGAQYPARWRLQVAELGIDLEVEPLLSDQELRTGRSTGVTYWEGLCLFRGTRNGREISGRGYVELVGYAESFRSRL